MVVINYLQIVYTNGTMYHYDGIGLITSRTLVKVSLRQYAYVTVLHLGWTRRRHRVMEWACDDVLCDQVASILPNTWDVAKARTAGGALTRGDCRDSDLELALARLARALRPRRSS
jgi:hypothetical protein